jgi:predicted DNA-binding transcriptional regulator AlpA
MHTKPEVNRWLSKAEVITRYGITQRTLERWLKNERFPAADLHLPGGQPRWSDAAIEAHERAAVGKKATAPP